MSRNLSQWLVHRAAALAPAELSARLEEEWSSDMAARTSEFSRLRFALGCCWATRVISHELQPSLVPATPSAMGAKLMIAYAQHNVGFYSRRTMSMFLVIGAHAAVFAALIWTISSIPIPVDHQLTVRQIPNEHKPDKVRVVTDTVFEKPNISVYRPELPPEENTHLDEVTADHLPPQTVTPILPQPAVHGVTRVPGNAGPGFPDTGDYYPPGAIRQGIQGLSVVKVCVNAKGRLTAAPLMAQSSGAGILDEAALKLAKAGSGHYRPSTEDGAAVDSCFQVGVRFQIKN